MRLLFPLLALAMVILPCPSASAPAKSAGGFDTASVRKLYQDGDFEQAIAILDRAIKENRIPEHRDSVFVFKHLGVMYAASENTRERGKYFMLQLLTIEPTARIMDMYASDMIYMIFRNIQEEFSMTHAKHARPDNLKAPDDAEPRPSPERPAQAKASGKGKALLWGGAAALAVGAGVTLYVLSASEEAVTTKNHEVK